MKGVARLVYQFDPDNYRLELRPDRDKMTFSGTVLITGRKIGRPSRRLVFHQKNLKINSVKLTYLDKKKGPLNKSVGRINQLAARNELRIHSAETLYPGRYQVEIDFSGRINEQMHGLYASNFKLEGRPAKLIATQLESHHAREIFPCIDEPAAKATFDLTLVTPLGEEVISNTPIRRQSEKNDLTTVFETTPKMSTYLLAFAYGALKFKESETKNGVKVRCYATPANFGLLDFSLNVAVRAVDFFEDYFDTKYPLAKLDMLALPDFSAGAMENWGLITYRENCMLIDPTSSGLESKQFAAIIICHEIAHQWFGNLVTMQWWDDLWLNESFATIMEYRAVDELFPDWNIWEHFINNEAGSALRRDCLPNVQAVRQDVNHPDEISTLFDPSIVYAKGSVLLRMLMNDLGEEKFKQGLKDYFAKYSYGNTRGRDLWSALSDAAEREVGGFMNHWINTPGFPVVIVDYQPGSDRAKLTQHRLVIGADQGAKTGPWPIPLAASLNIEPALLATPASVVAVTTKKDVELLLNDDCRSYFVTNYLNPDHFSSILKLARENRMSTINRSMLLQNYSLLERACQTSTVLSLEVLSAYRAERDEPVWSSMSAVIGGTKRLVFDTAGEEPLKKFVAHLAAPLIKHVGWSAKASEPIQTQRLRELALGHGAASEIPAIINEGLSRFSAFDKPSDLTPDIRSVVYYIGSRHGGPDGFQKLLTLYKSTDAAEEKEEICAALTSTENPVQITRLLEMLTTKDVRLQDIATWFAHLMGNPHSRDLTWDWLVSHWQWLYKQYGEDPTLDRYPRYAAAVFSFPEELNKYKQFLAPKITDKALRRAVQLGIEEIEGRIKWRIKNEAETIDWLKRWTAENI